MESKILSVYLIATFLVTFLSNHVTEGMPLGEIISTNHFGLGFDGRFKAVDHINTEIDLESSEENGEASYNLNQYDNANDDDREDQQISLAEPEAETDISFGNVEGLDTSDEKEVDNISEDIPEESEEPEIDEDWYNLDNGDNSEEKELTGIIDAPSEPDLVETSTKLEELVDYEINIGDAEQNSGYDYSVRKSSGIGGDFSLTNGNDDYYVGNEDDTVLIFAGETSGRPIVDYGYYNFDSDNDKYAKNLI